DVLTITIAPWDKAWDASKWILYLDGVPIEGIYPDNRDFQKKGQLRFTLRRNDKNKAHWAVLFDEAYEPGRWTRPVTVAIGTQTAVNPKIKEYPLSSESSDQQFTPFQLVAISELRLVFAVLLPLVLLVLLLAFLWNKGLLRDTS